MLGTLNNGEWPLQAVPSDASQRDHLHYRVEFGVGSQTEPSSIGIFEEKGCVAWQLDHPTLQDAPYLPGCSLMLAYDANTIATRRIRRVEDELYTVMERVDDAMPTLPPHGRPPASLWHPGPHVPQYLYPGLSSDTRGSLRAYGRAGAGD